MYIPGVSASQSSTVGTISSGEWRVHNYIITRYIFSQCLGAFIASICVWGQYHRELGVSLIYYTLFFLILIASYILQLLTTALKAAGKEAQIFSSSG